MFSWIQLHPHKWNILGFQIYILFPLYCYNKINILVELWGKTFVCSISCYMSWWYLIGAEPSAWFATWYWHFIVHMWHVIYGCLCGYCWFGALLWIRCRHSYFFCLCKIWNGLGRVSRVSSKNLSLYFFIMF